METIYTIPVNEVFEESDGCPFCRLYSRLEQNETELILGGSLMDPDIRDKTDKLGFCGHHYESMYNASNRLGLALMMETHLNQVIKRIKSPTVSLKNKGEVIASAAHGLSDSCYICSRIDFHFSKMFETAALLWENDRDFKAKLDRQPYFCLKHYARFLDVSRAAMSKKTYSEFVSKMDGLEMAYIEKLKGDVSWFCDKFDYRFKDEPWKDSKDAVERVMKLLG